MVRFKFVYTWVAFPFGDLYHVLLAGLHPNGIPCSKKHSERFEHITRDVSCLPSAEYHLPY